MFENREIFKHCSDIDENGNFIKKDNNDLDLKENGRSLFFAQPEPEKELLKKCLRFWT